MKRKRRWTALFVLLAFAAFAYLNNSSLFVRADDRAPLLLAHRGMAQTFPMEGIENDTCTAERIYPPEHDFLENTIPSIEEAFRLGADVVEFDVHLTKDKQFAVFHDWTLDCRTDFAGTTGDYTMEELRAADIGHGYTADGGQTYPFRGTGVGMMPSLTEVLDRFPDKELLINVKSSDPEEGRLLAGSLSKLPEERRRLLSVYGGDEPIAALKAELPDVRVMSKATIKACLLPYVAIGWTGIAPSACKGTQLHVPEKIAPWLWGWPRTFVARMEEADTRVVLVGGDGSEFSTGFDTVEDTARLPREFAGVLWTNRIDRIAPVYKRLEGSAGR